jgi:hypothetical protein
MAALGMIFSDKCLGLPFVANAGGTAVTDASTFGGYTLRQVV